MLTDWVIHFYLVSFFFYCRKTINSLQITWQHTWMLTWPSKVRCIFYWLAN